MPNEDAHHMTATNSTKHSMLVNIPPLHGHGCCSVSQMCHNEVAPGLLSATARSPGGWRLQVAASLSSSLNPAGEARPVLPGPGQTLNLASTFAAAAAKATAVQPDLAPQVPTFFRP